MSDHVLRAPLPVNSIQFEQVFRGEYHSLIQLSKARSNVLDVCVDNDASAERRAAVCLTYYERWTAFIATLPRAVATREFVHFTWTHALFPSLPTYTDQDTSCVYESVCAGLAVVATQFALGEYTRAAHILGRVNSTAAAFEPRFSVPPARPGGPFADVLQQQGDGILAAVAQRPREPAIMAPSLRVGAQHVITSFAAFTIARSHVRTAPKLAAEHLFAAAREMQLACSVVPRCSELTQSLCRAHAYAYQVLSVCVMQHQEIGIAIACMQEAVAYARVVGLEEQLQTRLDALLQRNKVEFAYQAVPDRANLHISFTEPGTHVQIRRNMDDALITILGLELPSSLLDEYKEAVGPQ